MTFRKGVSGNPAGRPKGSKNRYVLDEKIRREVTRTGETPLEALLAVMRDPREKVEVRLDAAKAAAPYMHRKMPVAIAEPAPAESISIEGLQNLSPSEKEDLLALFDKICMPEGPAGEKGTPTTAPSSPSTSPAPEKSALPGLCRAVAEDEDQVSSRSD